MLPDKKSVVDEPKSIVYCYTCGIRIGRDDGCNNDPTYVLIHFLAGHDVQLVVKGAY